MISNLITQFLNFLSSVGTSLVSNIFILGLVYIIIWVVFAKALATKRIQTVKRAGYDQIKNELINFTLVIITNTLFIGIVFWMRDKGLTQFYTETGKYGIWYEILIILGIFLIGDVVQTLLPVGDFGIVTDEASEKNYLMIAGGSGITPLYSMIRTLLVKEPKSKITLFYSNKTTESTIFLKEISELVKQYPEQFAVKHFTNGVRFGEGDVTEYIKASPEFETYICGPQSLKSAARMYLKNHKVDEKNIHTEDFVDGYVPWFGIGHNQKPKLATV
jgi:uncharacterized SAM-binding protein YcdF (DUF218 family)